MDSNLIEYISEPDLMWRKKCRGLEEASQAKEKPK